MTDQFHSKQLTLHEIVENNYFFTVPIYQRLYVWSEAQIRTLLDDLWCAWKRDEDIYYLGGTLVTEQEQLANGGRVFELIDGQQRFTTLWMMSLVWRGELKPFLYRYEEKDRRLRIGFPIRPEVRQFFLECIDKDNAKESLQEHPIIENALASINLFKEENQTTPNGFDSFLYKHVKLVLTEVPPHTDLNKLFEVINNRGVQLQHHEILKARLLNLLPRAERGQYALLWDSCSHMDDYLEENFKKTIQNKQKNTDKTDWFSSLFSNENAKQDREAFKEAVRILEQLYPKQAVEPQDHGLKLQDILDNLELTLKNQEESTGPNTESYDSSEARSIISFPILLQHVLRIWLHQNGKRDLPRILDRELLKLFDEYFLKDANEEESRSFIQMLWTVRYLFDKHVIKWVNTGEEEQHLIKQLRLSESGSSLSRVDQPQLSRGFALLQSMLYHSQAITTQYWLTPFLAWLYRHPGSIDQHYAYLRHLENHLLCNDQRDQSPLIIRSGEFLDKPKLRKRLDCKILEEPLGTSFPSYWFYKLEFVLWYCYVKSGEMKPSVWQDKDEGFRWSEQYFKWKYFRISDTFRITAKNSVEHISPQNPQQSDQDKILENVLHTFGNLALVSRSVNSEFSNKPYNEKRDRFLNKSRERMVFDSLKMALIYQNPSWNDDRAMGHRQDMIKVMQDYLEFDHLQQAGIE